MLSLINDKFITSDKFKLKGCYDMSIYVFARLQLAKVRVGESNI